MRRNSIKKASTFKLQAARARFNNYLGSLQECAVAKKFPDLLECIRETSESVFDLCYTFRDESPFLKGLNYDEKFIGFACCDGVLTYRQFLPKVSQAYLMGTFNNFNKTSHPLQRDEDCGEGWHFIEIDVSVNHIPNGSRIMLRIVDQNGVESHMIPPSCHTIDKGYGVYQRAKGGVGHLNKFKATALLAYTIDITEQPLETCIEFVEKEAATLQCFNTIILKNMFKNDNGLLYRFSLSFERSEMLTDLIEKLNSMGIRTVLEWNFEPSGLQYNDNIVENYFVKSSQQGFGKVQLDLSKEETMAYYLANIAYYYKMFGIGGIHFTNVHSLCSDKHGITLIKCINLLSERLSEMSVTLASSKHFIPGLTEPILQGGLGFSFTYNHHESLQISQAHVSLYEVVKQIHCQSNCLSLNFSDLDHTHYIYLLFTFLICKKGVFTRGPFQAIREDLQKILRLRKQEELFSEESELLMINEDCLVLRKGKETILFNFTPKELDIPLPNADKMIVLFNEIEQQLRVTSHGVVIAPMNCLLMELAD